MPIKTYPKDVLKQAQEVANAWNQINATLAFGTLKVSDLMGDITTVTALTTQIGGIQNQLTELCNRLEQQNLMLWDKVKRTRAGMKAAFGDDSSQYERIGGTRVSDRKSPARKATTA